MKYKTIVIDPPWDIKPLVRTKVVKNDRRSLDYKTMSVDDIKQFNINEFADDICNIFLWTTQKYLPYSFDILKEWGFKFHCLMTWNKENGFCPMSFRFTEEFVLFGYRGGMKLDKIGKSTRFFEKRGRHSRKPNIFFEIIKEVSPEPRVSIFEREKREGFDVWGDEAPN
jgi:N6-adenosine-specific RNA methylase IME4